MLHPLAFSFAAAFALAGQSTEDVDAMARLRLAEREREVMADLRDPAVMRDSARATMVRMAIQSSWKSCAEVEAGTIARVSERPARIVAEAALATCLRWGKALRLALENGAYPYSKELVSREDMVMQVELEARDAALARVLRWRGAAPRTAAAAPPPAAKPSSGPVQVAPLPPRPAVIEPQPQPQQSAAAEGEEIAIVVTGKREGGCRVRFADRMLTKRQLAQKAREWAAAGITLRLVRPAGADYRCLSKIVWDLGQYGMRKFLFLEPSDLSTTAPELR